MYIFGYGSLVNIASAQKSFKRELKHEDFIPVVVSGYKKVWNSIECIVFDADEEIVNGIFLNLQKDESESTNGVLLKITPEEFEFLKLREKNYSCIEINSVQDFVADEKVYTFMTTNEAKIAKDGDSSCFIPRKYIGLLEDGLEPYDKQFKKEFITSYSNYPFLIKEGTYKFSDPIQNRFAKDGIKNEQ
jgi:hypothetical protein